MKYLVAIFAIFAITACERPDPNAPRRAAINDAASYCENRCADWPAFDSLTPATMEAMSDKLTELASKGPEDVFPILNPAAADAHSVGFLLRTAAKNPEANDLMIGQAQTQFVELKSKLTRAATTLRGRAIALK